MNSTQVLEWQSPYVDIFKYYNVFDGSGHDKKGNIGIFQDNTIGRRVFRIQGSISATNYISFPPSKSTIQTLGCNGKYLYVEFFPQEFFFSIHFDFTITKRNPVRFTLSNLYDSFKVTSSNTLQIPFPKDVRNQWVVLCIDIEHLLEKYPLFPPNTFQSFKQIYILKSVQICSTLSIRGIYTSDNRYTPATLPREMDYKMPKGDWEDTYKFLYIPGEPEPKHKTLDIKPGRSILKKATSKDGRSSSRTQQGKSPKKKKSRSPTKQSHPTAEDLIDQPHPVKAIEKVPEKPPVKPEERAKIPWYRPPTESVTTYNDQKGSLLDLKYVLGFSGRNCPDVKWSKDPENPNEVLFASGNIVVGYSPDTAEQRFFTGNTSSISCLEVSRDGSLIVAGQEERDPCVKVFDYRTTRCIGTIPVKMNEVRSVSISYNNKYVSVAGVDTYNRDLLTIWDLEALQQDPRNVRLVAKQMSEFNILTCKFSPIEADKLVSCGRENIRFWRIKNDHISGGAVVLSHHARDTVFTVLDFDFNHENPATALQSETTKRVFVGTKQGLLLQVNYLTRELEGVFKLHDSCICSLSVSAGFCVTGSEDQYLRVWPLDFSEYFLEAGHKGIVISLDISQDSLRVISGVSSGGLSILDLTNQNYRTLLRTHTARIKQIDTHAFSNYLVTLCEDLTIRVWDANKLDQIYEFSYPKEDPCTCISSDPRGLFLAAGFQSGILRIFDFEQTRVSEESKYHNSAVSCVQYSPSGKYLVTGDQPGNYNLFDVERGFQPVKVFEAEIENDNPQAAFTNDSATLATTGSYTTHINLWDLNRFFRRGRIIVKSSTVKSLKFTSNDLGLVVLLNDGKIKMYGVKLNEPVLLRDVVPGSKIGSNCLQVSANNHYLLTGCDDAKVRVWNINTQPGEPKQVFPQEGHARAVNSVAFSNDGQFVYSAGHDEGIYVWAFNGETEPIEEHDEDLESFSHMVPGRPLQKIPHSPSQHEESEVDKLGYEIFVKEDENQKTEEEHKSPTLSEVKKNLMSPGTPPMSINKQTSPMKDVTNKELSAQLQRTRSNQYNTLEDDLRSEKTQGHSLSPLESRTQVFLKGAKSGIIRRAYKFKKPNPRVSVSSPNKSPKKIVEPPGRKYVKSYIRENHKLPFKHYAVEGDGRLAEQKSKEVFKHRNMIGLDYLVGYNNDAHSNIVWNIPGGWFAYAIENYLVIEQLLSQRSQKVITLPDYISCLALSKDNSTLAVGSVTYDSNIYSNIHIVDCYNLKLVRTLKFHNKGVQSLAFSLDGKYLISAGNYRECTVAVWDAASGQLIASSYTLTNINEVKAKPYTRTGVLEFVTVGADQVFQWILTTDSKLLNSEATIHVKNTKSVELTAFSFVLVNERDYILAGTSEGELILFDLSTGDVEIRRKVTTEEIVDIETNNAELKAVITAMDSKVYQWNYSEKLKFDEDSNFTNIDLKYPATCLHLDESLNEGLLGSLDGGILYANFAEDVFSKLVGAPSVENYVIRYKELDENLFVTFHAFGSVKLWNAINGEELHDFTYSKITCKDVLLHKGRSELYFFYDDNSCKVVDAQNFEKVTQFIIDEVNVQPGEEARYIQDSTMVHEPGQDKPYYFCITNKGELYVSDLKEKDEINLTEVMEQLYAGNLANFSIQGKHKIINICFDDATIQTYSYYRGNQPYPDVGQIDLWNLMDDPHGDLDRNEEAKAATMTIYGTKAKRSYKISTAWSENRGIFFVTTQYLQYVIMRNALNREIVRRISLENFPLSVCYDLTTRTIIAGLDDGWIMYYDTEGREILRQRNFNDGPVIGLRISRDEDHKKLIAVEKKAMTIYKYAQE